MNDIQALRSSRAENVQWNLGQIEREFQAFKTEVDVGLYTGADSLPALRAAYDVLYNRIDIFQHGQHFATIRNDARFSRALASVRSFAMDLEPLIDSPDATLQDNLDLIANNNETIGLTIRRLSSLAVHYLAEQADVQRANVTRTLTMLAATTLFLLASLGVLAYYSDRMRRHSDKQSQNLLDSSRRLRSVVSTSLDAVLMLDHNGHILEFNNAATEVFDIPRTGAIGRPVSDFIYPKAVAEQTENDRIRFAATEPKDVISLANKGRVRITALKPDGTVFPIEMSLQQSEMEGKNHYISFIRDISDRVRTEQDLIEARDQALEGEKAKSRFLAIMSHEIRTPMNGLLGNLALLRDTDLNEEQLDFIHNMEISGKLLTNHVNDVLDIARFDDSKLVVRNRPTDLTQVIKAVVDSQNTHATMQGNTLSTVWKGPKRQWIFADPGRLQQILINLVSNAIKFTQDGDITIEIETKDSSNLVEFRIHDTGIGIADEDKAKVFEDFVTQDATYGRQAEGTGLGLGIVRRITEVLGGKLGLESTLNVGSTFWVKLPLEPADDPATKPVAQPTANEEDSVVDPLDVLVVEDNEINRNVVRAMLSREGHKVYEASDGQSGANLAAQQRFDLILMDISMPIMDGQAATRLIRSGNGASANTPIIALTAHVLPENVTEFMQTGMQDVLPKPLMRKDLTRILNSFGPNASSSLTSEGGEDQIAPLPADQLVVWDINEALRDSVGSAYGTLLTTLEAELRDLSIWLAGETQNLPEIGHRCHKFASSAAVFGAEPLRQHLIDMELAAKSGNEPLLNLRREMLPDLLNNTLDLLRVETRQTA